MLGTTHNAYGAARIHLAVTDSIPVPTSPEEIEKRLDIMLKFEVKIFADLLKRAKNIAHPLSEETKEYCRINNLDWERDNLQNATLSLIKQRSEEEILRCIHRCELFIFFDLMDAAKKLDLNQRSNYPLRKDTIDLLKPFGLLQKKSNGVFAARVITLELVKIIKLERKKDILNWKEKIEEEKQFDIDDLPW